MKKQLYTSFVLIVALTSCGQQDDSHDNSGSKDEKAHTRYDELLAKELSAFAALPNDAQNPDNPSSLDKVKLGHALYYDTRLSLTGNNSCNSCHNLKTFGVDNLPTSPGDEGENGDRNSPTTLNAALHTSQFWDGRMKDVEEQAGGPVLNPVEMNMPNEASVEKRLSEVPFYQEMFSAAFPDDSKPISYANMRKAIGAFERELLTPSRVDKYLKGDKDALTLQEKKGMLSFSYIGCTTCHNGALLGGDQIQRFGVHQPYWEATGSTHVDGGLFEQTNDSFDLYLFKVPSLRNVSETHPYFHDGSISDLDKAVKIMAQVQLDYTMNKSEVENVVAFLEALNGDVSDEYKKNPLASIE